ncbi:MAG: ThuA domain-containing protein [Lentisphaeraceae bacterium]|nr:ThuA domain-containing protein [Lentisphaeraceae bacterium]
MKLVSLFVGLLFLVSCQSSAPKKLKVLQLAGGCCHDYPMQMEALEKTFEASANCEVTTFIEGTNRTHKHSKLLKANWSAGYDVILMSFCYGHVKDDDYIMSIVDEASKNNKSLVFLHCSLHNFRSTEKGTNAWRELMGLTSKGHEKKETLVCENTAENHPIMKGFPQAKEFPVEEVYIITKIHENTKELGRAFGRTTKRFHPVIWTSEYKGCKVFGTSIGHSNVTYKDADFLNLVSRGLQWTAGTLED